MYRKAGRGFILASQIAGPFDPNETLGLFRLAIANSDRFVYFAFFAACSAACLTDEFAAAETFVALD
jgi:hypothetical protein